MIAATHYRSLLNHEEQDAYRTIVNHFLQHRAMFTIIAPRLDRASIQKVVHAVNYDHPEVFWVNYWNYRVGKLPHGYRFQFEMLLDRTASDSVSKTLSQRCGSLKEKMEKCTSSQQKYMEIARDILVTTSYLDSDNAFWDHTAAGPILRHTTVCEGLAKFFLFLCQRYDLPCAVIGGTVNGARHAWNMVELDGKKLFIDVTSFIDRPRYFLNLQFFKTGVNMRRHGYKWNEANEGGTKCEYQNNAQSVEVHHGITSAITGPGTQ